MVLPLIAGFIGGLLIGSMILFLTYEDIIDWFDEYLDTLRSNKNNLLGFTQLLQDELENGNYQVVQGIFNHRTGNVIEERVIEAEEIDDELLEIHEEYEDENGLLLHEV